MRKLCYGCMQPKEQSPICEHCGYNEYSNNQPHQLPVGSVLRGQYRVGKVLGQGGFGITYIGLDEVLNVPVAIKEFYPSSMVARDCAYSMSVSNNSGSVEAVYSRSKLRFLREARALAKFSGDPGIVHVYNFFEENNTAYIVMEYVAGMDLRHYIQMRGGRLTAAETFRILRPVMEALGRIHDQNLVHRDISPDNIMLQRDGSAKLLDFGAVREVEDADVEGQLAQSTEAILKHGFAPIEQYQSRGGLGPWTDVYALCATIYYCLTGRIPVDAPKRLFDDVDLDWDTLPGLTAGQVRALEKGTMPKPKDRTRSMRELREGLFPSSPPKPEPPRQNPPRPEPPRQTPPRPEPPRPNYPKPEPPRPLPVQKKKKWPLLIAAVAAVVILVAAVLPSKPKSEQAKNNILSADVVDTLGWENAEYVKRLVFGRHIMRSEVLSVSILDTVKKAPDDAWDVSEQKDGSVLAWVEPNGDLYDLYIAGEGGVTAPEDCTTLFAFYTNAKSFQFDDNFFTTNTTSMHDMFLGCVALEELDLGCFDTSNVTDMISMFHMCSSLRTVDVSGFNTENVTDTGFMFGFCSSLEGVDVSSFSTSNVHYMNWMFYNCTTIRELDLSGFDFSNVTEMDGMFYCCSALETLDLGEFDVSNVTSYDDFMDEGKTVNGRPWIELFEQTETDPDPGSGGLDPDVEQEPENVIGNPGPEPADSEIRLELEKTDITIGLYYQYALELKNGLSADDVEWESEHPHIATVDENGVVTGVKTGVTKVIVRYGEQTDEVTIRVT